jgi:hypothetical protein
MDNNQTQVLLSFLVSALMLVLLVSAYYITVYDPKLDPFRKQGSKDQYESPNPIDCQFLDVTRGLVKGRRFMKSALDDAFNKVREM